MKKSALRAHTMGGFGSGRNRYATTPEDRECLKLDINEFTDVLGTDGSHTGTVSWGDAEIQVAVPQDDTEDDGRQVRLNYTTTREGDTTEHDYVIETTRTSCNFGGSRPWWRCPRCWDRVGTLYLPPGRERFACRDCHDVAYTSSRASGNDDRTLRMRFNRIRRKLGAGAASPSSLAYRPDRPKGMHQDTYEELLRELDEAGERWHREVYLAGLQKYGDGPESTALE